MAKGDLHGRNLSSALMRRRVRNDRDRGGEPIRLALAVGRYGVSMEKDYLTLKSAPASRPGEWSDDDYDYSPMATMSAASSRQLPRQ